MMNDFPAITAAIQVYLEGLYQCDTELLGRVFHPKAIYATADETPMLFRTMDEYFAVVAARVSPASRNEPRNDVIESIDLAGKNTALARVRCTFAAKDFVDFLTFVRVDGAWLIISKVFQMTDHTSENAPENAQKKQ